MNRRRTPLRRLFPVVLALGGSMGLAACDPTADGTAIIFSSAPPESESMTGREWQVPVGLEINPTNPDNNAGVTVQGFDLVGNGTGDGAMLVASLFESDTAAFQPYGRLYSQANGWALPGSQFRKLASFPGAGIMAVGNSPGGTVLAVGFDTGGTTLMTASYDGIWATAATQAVSSPLSPLYVSTDHQDYGMGSKVVFDALGRAYVTGKDYSSNPAGMGVSVWQAEVPAARVGVATAGGGNRFFDEAFDGVKRLCATFESANKLQTNCFDTATQAGFQGSSTAIGGSLIVYGHALASDGAGTIRAVFFGRNGPTVWGLYTATYSGGSWSSVTQIDTAEPTGFSPAPAACSPTTSMVCNTTAYPKPAIAYVGDGKYVVAWMSVDTTDKVAGIFYSIYTPLDGWGSVRQVGDAYTYTSRPRFHSPRLAGNSTGDATIAVPFLSTEGATTASDVYTQLVGRFQVDVGFKHTQFVGTGCRYSGAGVAVCSHPPRPAIFSDGSGLVVYPDQDVSLRFRLMSVEFE